MIRDPSVGVHAVLTPKETRDWVREHRGLFDGAVGHLLQADDAWETRLRARSGLFRAVRNLAPFPSDPDERAPRRADLLNLLREIRGETLRLRRKLTRLEAFLWSYVEPRSRDFEGIQDYSRHLDRSGIFGADADQARNRSPLIEFLFGVEDLVDFVATETPSDRGGRSDLEREIYGNPKMDLVVEAGILFLDFGPEGLSGSYRGGFHEFVGDLFQLVTGGDDPEGERVGLKRYVQFAAPLLRKLNSFRDEDFELFKAATSRISAAEMTDVERRRNEIRTRKSELWDTLHRGPA